MNLRSLLPAACCLALLPVFACAQASRQISLAFDLDKIVDTTAFWDLTPGKLEELCKERGFKEPPQFKWLTQTRDGARFTRKPYSNVTVDMTIFGGKLPVEEAVIEFKNGKASGATISLYNRGDSGKIKLSAFDELYKTSGRLLGEALKVAPKEQRLTGPTAVKTTAWLWTAPTMLALLEFNADAMKSQPEFLRLKLSQPADRNQLLGIAAIGQGVTTLKPSDLPKFVKKESGGDVYVSGVPMVDQGAKGYCVAASCERMFGYLHIKCDQHELASVAGTDSNRGTSSIAFAESLSKISSRFKVRFKPLIEDKRAVKPDKFIKTVQEHVDKGLPLLWALELGRYKEDPPTAMQSGGGHMRMIIGYNLAKNQVIFTDSWGAGHEMKRMDMGDALKATFGVFMVEPQVRL